MDGCILGVTMAFLNTLNPEALNNFQKAFLWFPPQHFDCSVLNIALLLDIHTKHRACICNVLCNSAYCRPHLVKSPPSSILWETFCGLPCQHFDYYIQVIICHPTHPHTHHRPHKDSCIWSVLRMLHTTPCEICAAPAKLLNSHVNYVVTSSYHPTF